MRGYLDFNQDISGGNNMKRLNSGSVLQKERQQDFLIKCAWWMGIKWSYRERLKVLSQEIGGIGGINFFFSLFTKLWEQM